MSMSQYLFIEISKYLEQKCLLCKGPKRVKLKVFIESIDHYQTLKTVRDCTFLQVITNDNTSSGEIEIEGRTFDNLTNSTLNLQSTEVWCRFAEDDYSQSGFQVSFFCSCC